MTVFTRLLRTCALTGANNRLGRLVGYGAPGAREVAADTICSRIGCHMLGQLRLGICHVGMAGSTVVTARTAGIGICKVVVARLNLGMRVAHTVEVHTEARVVAIIMTRRTRRGGSTLVVVQVGVTALQRRWRRMTQRTVIIMDSGYYVVAAHSMTGNTVCIGSDRGVTKTVIYVMRRVTMISTSLLGMTISTVSGNARQYHAGYRSFRCVTKLARCLCISMTRITVTDLVVMQRVDRGPGADRMTVTATRTAGCLVSSTAVITHAMTACRRMRRMAVKISCMTIGAVALGNHGCIGTR